MKTDQSSSLKKIILQVDKYFSIVILCILQASIMGGRGRKDLVIHAEWRKCNFFNLTAYSSIHTQWGNSRTTIKNNKKAICQSVKLTLKLKLNTINRFRFRLIYVSFKNLKILSIIFKRISITLANPSAQNIMLSKARFIRSTKVSNYNLAMLK